MQKRDPYCFALGIVSNYVKLHCAFLRSSVIEQLSHLQLWGRRREPAADSNAAAAITDALPNAASPVSAAGGDGRR